ncbi:hypothetical protein C0Q70_19919 [Pomacea canaliculata]|uniref:Uncharacterized protein n=1 Tax=Pomacea canaliculata TaxID=400727 RepID=A0A2T7NE27_POMCA|nr:hypothetical protein C0Q70_19919 [Pomacea canaliculata]
MEQESEAIKKHTARKHRWWQHRDIECSHHQQRGGGGGGGGVVLEAGGEGQLSRSSTQRHLNVVISGE